MNVSHMYAIFNKEFPWTRVIGSCELPHVGAVN